jgi:hypothetical protein
MSIIRFNKNLKKKLYFFLSIDIYDKDIGNIENEIDRIRLTIEQRYMNLIQLIENEKNDLLNEIEEHLQLNVSK